MTIVTSVSFTKRALFPIEVILAGLWVVAFTVVAFLPIPENALNAFPENSFLPPLKNNTNWLGTDQLGRDVYWYLFASAKTAWWLTFPPLLGATMFGIIIGTLSAHFAKKPMRVPLYQCLWIIISSLWLGYLIYLYINWVASSFSAFKPFWILTFCSMVVLSTIYFGLQKVDYFKKLKSITVSLPLDEMLQRVMDLWTTFPKLLLLLLLSALAPPSIISMGFWIMVTYWVLSARISRARVLHIKNEPFYEAAIALGTPKSKLLHQYLWPSMKGQLITNFCFNASGLLGIGSTLAFLGIGLPADVPSWGKMLALSRYSLESWWLLFFPATLLILSILSLQSLGNYITKSRL